MPWYHISATITYVIRLEKHTWKVRILQRVKLSALIKITHFCIQNEGN